LFNNASLGLVNDVLFLRLIVLSCVLCLQSVFFFTFVPSQLTLPVASWQGQPNRGHFPLSMFS